MLGPQDRRLLLDALRPPEGYSLDFAVGTTFSLDLLALLTAPLAFTFFDCQDAEGKPNQDPLALLEALRRHADRITIFCQAGQILVPKQHRILFGYLENSVFAVTPPGGAGSFHAKFWALRFVAEGSPVRYRLLCLSRNLTFDRSWDTALVLEGSVIDRKNAFAGNHPLGDFVASLPTMAVGEVPEATRERTAQCAHELRRVEVELPEGFEEFRYWPLGHDGKKAWPFPDHYNRLLVVSLFLSEGLLGSLSESADEALLVSRLESLEEMSSGTLSGFSGVYALNPSAEVEESLSLPEGQEEQEGQQEQSERTEDLPVSGLHAKLYIAERGWNASVITGSANATAAAFGANVEFLVELIGKKSRVGIDPFLEKSQGSLSFADLLQPYTPSGDTPAPDALQKELEERVEKVRRLLGATPLTAHVCKLPEHDLFRVSLQAGDAGPPTLPAGVQVRCWPITLREFDAAAFSVASSTAADFSPLSFVALTSFFAFDAVAQESSRQACARFVLNLPLVGAPENRRERILRTLLSNREQVLRFLMFLLSEFGAQGNPADLVDGLLGERHAFGRGWQGFPLFESLLRALDRSPGKLDQVARLVEDLRVTDGAEGLLPEGFDEVWQPIWAARQRAQP
jgi:hypothetical protein